MRTARFIHCADLHIDSPFKGISETRPDIGKALQRATHESFHNIVDLALREEVDFVVIAGDVFDSADRSLRAQLKFRDEVQRLASRGIEVFLTCGNHDPLSGWSAMLEWPEGMYTFSGDCVESHVVRKDGEALARVCGISFSERDVYENLARKFESVEGDIPCVGVLHATVGAVSGHEPYAPCVIDDLCGKGVSYWALGHVHARSVLREEEPAVAYPGCSQSRHPNERGEKGCYLVTLEPGAPPFIQFIPTDMVRYCWEELDVSGCGYDEILGRIEDRSNQIAQAMDGRHVVLRVTLTGRTTLHGALQTMGAMDELLEQVRERLSGRSPWVWLEKVVLGTAGFYDVETLRRGEDFVADVISVFDELERAEEPEWEEMRERLDVVERNWQGHRYVESLSRQELTELIRQARTLTLDRLVRSD
ncbi:MAG: metallophosphoesterase family protein [Chloroflexota bacterium]